MNPQFLEKLKEYKKAQAKYLALDKEMVELTLKLQETTKERNDAKQKQAEKLKTLAAMEV